MSGYTPTLEQVRNIYANSREDEREWEGEKNNQTIFESQAEFDRFLAEYTVERERAAAEKAWTEGVRAQWHWEHYDRRHVGKHPCNPYRLNEGEKQ